MSLALRHLYFILKCFVYIFLSLFVGHQGVLDLLDCFVDV